MSASKQHFKLKFHPLDYSKLFGLYYNSFYSLAETMHLERRVFLTQHDSSVIQATENHNICHKAFTLLALVLQPLFHDKAHTADDQQTCHHKAPMKKWLKASRLYFGNPILTSTPPASPGLCMKKATC